MAVLSCNLPLKWLEGRDLTVTVKHSLSRLITIIIANKRKTVSGDVKLLIENVNQFTN